MMIINITVQKGSQRVGKACPCVSVNTGNHPQGVGNISILSLGRNPSLSIFSVVFPQKPQHTRPYGCLNALPRDPSVATPGDRWRKRPADGTSTDMLVFWYLSRKHVASRPIYFCLWQGEHYVFIFLRFEQLGQISSYSSLFDL